MPEFGSRAADSSDSHGAEADEGHSEVDGGGGSDGVRGGGDVEEIREIRRGKIVDGLKCVQKDFEMYSEFDRKPVEML